MLLNNDGGGIFHFLPISGEGDAFEEHVVTPHGLDFERVASSTASPTSAPAAWSELRAALQPSGGCRPDRGAHRPDREPRPASTCRRGRPCGGGWEIGPAKGRLSAGTGVASAGERRQHHAELDLGLGELGGRVGVAHDPAAGVAAGQAVAQQSAAQGHAELAVAGGVRPAQRAGIPATVKALEGRDRADRRGGLRPDGRAWDASVRRARRRRSARPTGRGSASPDAGCWPPGRATARALRSPTRHAGAAPGRCVGRRSRSHDGPCRSAATARRGESSTAGSALRRVDPASATVLARWP